MAKVNITASTAASESTRLASSKTDTSMTKSVSAPKATTTVNKASSSSVGTGGVKITSSTNKTSNAVRMPNSNSASSTNISGAAAANAIVKTIVQNAVEKHGGDAIKVGAQVAKDLGEHIKPSIVKAKDAEAVDKLANKLKSKK